FGVGISWAFEMTPEGMKRTADVSPEEVRALPYWSKRKFAAFIVGVVVIAAALLTYQLLRVPRSTSTSAMDSKSIAVLPFENLSSDKENAYFASGIQDEIITRLAKIADLKVISRTSTQQYQSKPGNLSQIAKQLGVAHVLEGSVQKVGEQVRVNVQLIRADHESHLWTETYDRKLTDIFGVENDVAKSIAQSLQAKLSGREEKAFGIKPTDNPEAYGAYLRGVAAEGEGIDSVYSTQKAIS